MAALVQFTGLVFTVCIIVVQSFWAMGRIALFWSQTTAKCYYYFMTTKNGRLFHYILYQAERCVCTWNWRYAPFKTSPTGKTVWNICNASNFVYHVFLYFSLAYSLLDVACKPEVAHHWCRMWIVWISFFSIIAVGTFNYWHAVIGRLFREGHEACCSTSRTCRSFIGWQET